MTLTEFSAQLIELEERLTAARKFVHNQWCRLQPVATQEAWNLGEVDFSTIQDMYDQLNFLEDDVTGQFSLVITELNVYMEALENARTK